jgi:hypothetical protein
MRYDFKDESVHDVGTRFPKVDLKKDETARICVVSPYFEVTVRHWVTRMGYIHCHAKAESFSDLAKIEKDMGRPEECIMCSMTLDPALKDVVGMPMRHFATYVLRYHTDVRGQLLHDQLSYHLEIWLLGNKKYRELIRMQDEWGGLQTHDLELTCVEAKYQNFDISLKKEAHWLVQKDKVAEYLKIETVKYPLLECLGETVDKETLQRRFESARRRAFPDEEADLSASVISDPVVAPSGDDPFASMGEVIPAVATEKEKEKAQEPEDKSSLATLIP